MKFFFMLLRAILYIPVKLIFPVKVINRDLLKEKKQRITVSNHLHWSDVLHLAIDLPGFRHLLAKKEIGKNKLIKALAEGAGVVFIDRGKVALSSVRKIIGLLKLGHTLSIFPEGTRNREDNSLQEVKSGIVMFSLKSGAEIVPILIHDRSRAFRLNYMYVGEPFKLDGFDGQPVTSEVLDKGAKIVGDKMQETKDLLDEYIRSLKEAKAAKKNKKKRKTASVEIAPGENVAAEIETQPAEPDIAAGEDAKETETEQPHPDSENNIVETQSDTPETEQPQPDAENNIVETQSNAIDTETAETKR